MRSEIRDISLTSGIHSFLLSKNFSGIFNILFKQYWSSNIDTNQAYTNLELLS